MDLVDSLNTEFPSSPPGLTDSYIEKNPDPTCAEPAEDWLVIMPAYMSWCIRSPLRDELLVVDHTVGALANFGRYDKAEPRHLNFKSLCSVRQRAVVAAFLEWCLSGEVFVHEQQVKRSLKHWQEAASCPS